MIVSIHAIDWYVEKQGEGIPLLCIHGLYADMRLMQGALEHGDIQLEGIQRIYIDLIGMGQTKAKEYLTADQLLGELVLLVHELIGNRPFLMAGESYGGYLAMGLMAHFHQQVKGLFLLCAPVIASKVSRNLPEKQIAIYNDDLNSVPKHELTEFLGLSTHLDAKTFRRYKDQVLCGIRSCDMDFTKHLLNHGFSLADESQFANFLQDTAVTFLCGRMDHVVGYQDSYRLYLKLRHAEYFVLDNVGHHLQIEDPRSFNMLFDRFIRKSLKKKL